MSVAGYHVLHVVLLLSIELMNKLFIIFILTFTLSSLGSRAQDLVVTSQGDSLNCTVMVQNLKSISLFYKDGNEIITKELPASSYKTVVIGYFVNRKKAVSKSPAIKNIDSANTGLPEQQTEKAIPVVTEPVISARDTLVSEVKTDNDTLKPSVSDGNEKTEVAKMPAASPVTLSLEMTEPFGYSRWYFDFRGGYSNRLFRTGNKYSTSYTEYLKKLKSGYAIGVGTGYFFWKNVGLGINGELYGSTARMEDDSRDDAISIKYIGPSVFHRKVMEGKKTAVYTLFTAGYQTFSNNGEEGGNVFLLKGKSMGWGASVGFDYKISPHAALAFSASCLLGTLYKMTKETGGKSQTLQLSKSNFEELSRIALTVGLRFF
jgi:hypothetical protein